MPYSFQDSVRALGTAEAPNELPRLLFTAGRAEDEDDFLLLSVFKRRGDLHCSARVKPAPTRPESRTRRMAAGFAGVPLRPKNSVRSPVTVRIVSLQPTKTTRSANSGLYALRAKSAPQTGSSSVTTCMSDRSRSSPSTNSQ